MGLWSDLQDAWGVLTGRKAAEALGRETTQVIAEFQRRSLPAGRTKRGVLEAFHEFPILRSCVARLAWDVADTTWHVRQGEDQTQDHPAIDALTRPNDRQSGAVFLWATEAYLDTVGEAIWLVLGPSSYNASGFEYLTIPPTAAKAEKQKDGSLEWTIRLGDARLQVPDSNIIWMKHPNLLNPFGRGKGDGEVLSDELELEEYARDHLKSELYNHGQPAGQVHIAGATQAEMKAVKEKWYSEHGGPQNSGKLMFTGAEDPEGEMQYAEFSRSVADTKVLEINDDSREVARRQYNIPPEILGDSKDSNRATIEAAYYLYSKGPLSDRLGFLTSELNMRFMPLIGEPGELEPENVVPRDKKFHLSVMKAFPRSFEKNEARQLAEHEPLEELEGEFLGPSFAAGSPGPGAPTQPGGGEDSEEDQDDENDEERSVVLPLRGRTKSDEEDAERVAEQGISDEALEGLKDEYADATRRFAARVLEGLGAEISLDALEPGIQEKVGERMEWVLPEINAATRSQLKDTILKGFDEGLNPLEIKDEIKGLWDGFDSARARRIARTEMLSASNAGTHEAHKKGPVDYRSWLSTRDSDVRPEHEELDERTRDNPIPVEQPFEVHGHTADHPGDFGEAELDINCRCTTIAAFPEDEDKALTDEQRQKAWEAYDKALGEAEEEMAEVVRGAFDQQLEETLDAYERIIEDAA